MGRHHQHRQRMLLAFVVGLKAVVKTVQQQHLLVDCLDERAVYTYPTENLFDSSVLALD